MKRVKGAVIIPGEPGAELFRLDISNVGPTHSPNGWATLMGWDLLTGRCVSSGALLDSYEVLLVNGNVELYALIRQLKNFTSAKVILLEEGSRSSFSYAPPPEKTTYLEILNTVDAVGTLGQEFNFFKLFSDKPVGWLGVPFDVSSVQGFSVPLDKRNPCLWGVGSRLHSHNCIVSVGVAKKAGISQLLMQNFPSEDFEGVKKFCDAVCKNSDKDFSITLHAPYPWERFLEIYSSCWGAILMSGEYTWGRYSLDFAALGIPVVGSYRQFTQSILFPSLCFEPYLETGQAVEAAKRLMVDRDFYGDVARYADSLLGYFDLDASRERMEKFLEEIL